MKAKDEKYMIRRTPADMHGDGVYFNEELLTKKKQKELQKEKIKKATSKD